MGLAAHMMFANSGAAPMRRSDLRICLPLFAIVACVYWLSPVGQMSDSTFLTAVSHSLMTKGSFAVPEDLRSPASYQLTMVDGELYHYFPHAPAVLNVPFVWLFDQLGKPVFTDSGAFDREAEKAVLRVCAAVATAFTIVLSYLLARHILGVGWSLTLAIVFAFGTSFYSTASRPFWAHSWAVCLLTLGLLFVVSPIYREKWWTGAAAATALSWSFFCRPVMALSIVGVALLLARKDWRRQLPPYTGIGLAWALAFLLYSRAVLGGPIPYYFFRKFFSNRQEAMVADGLPSPWVATLFSPGRGLFVFSPVLLVLVLVLLISWRQLPSRWTAIVCLTIIAAHWGLVSSSGFWWGGGCFGPRLFTDALPWFFVLGALSLAALQASQGPVTRRFVPVAALLLVISSMASVFIHARGATSIATMRSWSDLDELEWKPGLFSYRSHHMFQRYRVWAWRYPQFMAGLSSPPPQLNFTWAFCPGSEEIVDLKCRNNLHLWATGTPGSRAVARSSSGMRRIVSFDPNGKAEAWLSPAGSGTNSVTVSWECGTIRTREVECR